MSFQNKRGKNVSLGERLEKFSQVIHELDPIMLKSPHDDEYEYEALYIMSQYSFLTKIPNYNLACRVINNVFSHQFYDGCITHKDVDVIAQHLMYIHESRKAY
jgi:hypothetical protein